MNKELNKKEREIEGGRKIRREARPTVVKCQLMAKAETGNIQVITVAP
jgi:hypothetical protein